MDTNLTDMVVCGSSRNHAFLDYFKTSNTLQGREKSIHHQLDDERKKYLELQNKRKMCRSNETEDLMPVTNVITHVRKPNVGTIQTNYSTIGEEMLLECKRLFQNDDSTIMRCRQIENARKQQNCSVDCTLDKKELNTKKIVRTEKSNSSNTDIKIDETYVLRSRQEELKENLEKKRKTKPAYDLQRNEFKNRLNIQKDIIKSQKQKLAEAEEEIQKMKIRQILEQNKISRNVVEENVRETIQNIDPKLKVAANQIIKFKNDEKRESHEKAKKLVESMEQRAKERKLKWQEIQERKKQKAEAKVKLLEEQEAARLQEEEEKKKKRIIELKEKRRVEQENARKKENERRRLNSLSVIAENFHKKKLKQRALRGFRENLESCLIKMELADKFYIYQLKRKCFMAWKFYTEEITAEKEHLAAHFYNYILKRRVFDTFKEIYNTRILNLQVAIDFRDLKIQEKYFSKWKAFCRWQRRVVQHQMKEADKYYCRRLLRHCFLRWRELPQIAFYEREKDKRIREWRDKVKEVLPDFVPFEVE
ncbi:hypothetical protein M8J77_017671 [Diaphorina citri]|nr:hypothetical protein M8J77_017671 [Diaphorina citri]